MSDSAVISRKLLNGIPALAGAVLIIDDEAEIRESLQTLLEMEGFAVETAHHRRSRACSGSANILSIWCCWIWRFRAAMAWKFSPRFALTKPACRSS